MAAVLPDDPVRLREQLGDLSLQDLSLLNWELSWKARARKKQLPPRDYSWSFYGIKSGRGFGKTLAASNWVGLEGAREAGSYNFVIAPTHSDLKETCFEGPTGLISVIPPTLIDDINSSTPSITLWQGQYFRGFSADTPERLRGPQSHRAWCDEIASWRYPQKVWDNLLFGLRLGRHPQILWTGTPKPTPFIRELVKLDKSIIVSGSTYENAENLPDSYYENVAKYEGTKIGRQELYGEIIDPEEAGFIRRSDWRLWPAAKPLPKFRFIVMSLDTALTEKQWNKKEQSGDPTACTVWGVFTYELKDHLMLLDAWEDYLGFPNLIRRVKLERTFTYGDFDEPIIKPALISKVQRPSHQGRSPDLLLIEQKSSGASLIQSLAEEGIFAESYDPDMDKLSRLHAVSPCFPHGRVWALESKKRRGEPVSWADPVITQCCTYVGDGSLEHDDLLDTTTQALLLLMRRFSMRFTTRVGIEEQVARASERLKRSQRRNPYDGR
jgi:predicted phage terminase large subunit-like protein